ncbi:MAG: AI-2E family transporter [Candidatus Pacebacteria bacterium]|nr:AI-2E family transporter [Candidatus Paceibacterota bacterium]
MNKQKQIVDISYESILKFFMVIFFIFLVFYLKDIILIIFISILLTLIMNPAVNKMQEKKIPRSIGASVLFLFAFSVIILIFYLVIPPLTKDVASLTVDLPLHMEDLGFNDSLDYNFSEPVQNIIFEASNSLKAVASNIVSGVLTILGGLLSAILIIVISFYLLIEKNGTEKFVQSLIPISSRPQALRIIQKIEITLGRWFMGQIFLGFIVGILSFIGLTIIGVPYALVLSIIAGSLELIPYIGPTLSSIPAIIIAFTISPLLAFLTFILYFLIQQVENYVLVPKVMQKSVGLHPVIIIIAMLVGGQIAGVMGMILAIPITTIISIILTDIYAHNK